MQFTVHPSPASEPDRSATTLSKWFVAKVHPLGAESATTSFDLPGDRAERTLKLLAARAGIDVVFTMALAAGVRTQAVKGNVTALAAAQRRLAGTPLQAAQRSAADAIIVGRRLPGGKSGPAPAAADVPARGGESSARHRSSFLSSSSETP